MYARNTEMWGAFLLNIRPFLSCLWTRLCNYIFRCVHTEKWEHLLVSEWISESWLTCDRNKWMLKLLHGSEWCLVVGGGAARLVHWDPALVRHCGALHHGDHPRHSWHVLQWQREALHWGALGGACTWLAEVVHATPPPNW